MFNRISGVYDFLNHLLSFNTDHSWRRRLAELALGPPSRGSDAKEESRSHRDDGRGLPPAEMHPLLVLDVCCGTGDSAVAVAKLMDENALVVGLDFAEQMLRRMQRKTARCKGVRRHGEVPPRDFGRGLTPGASKIAAVQGDAHRLPFRAGAFDAVTCAFGVRNLSDRPTALREMLRVTRRGGAIAILEFVRPASGVMRGPAMFYLRRILPILGRIFSGDEYNAYSYLPKSIMQFPTAEQFRREMLAAGCAEASFELNRHGLVAFFTGIK
jgi:demethylmenaquinone methyltransferase/2-methoxy-6-polyprenyl-1,4-benzoquinol methylase